MSRWSKNVWEALRVLGTEGARVHATTNYASLWERGFPHPGEIVTVNLNSWRKLKREGWVIIAAGESGLSEGFFVWEISEAGRRRLEALELTAARAAICAAEAGSP